MEFGWKTIKFPFQTWFWINRRILYIEMPFSYIKLFNWENIGYVAYPPEALFWSLKEDKYIHCRWMTSFVYLRNLATSDIPISGFPGWTRKRVVEIRYVRSDGGLGKRELILVLFVRLFGLCLFRFVGFLFLMGSGKGCGLWLWHSLGFSLTFFGHRHQKWGKANKNNQRIIPKGHVYLLTLTKPNKLSNRSALNCKRSCAHKVFIIGTLWKY